MKKSEFPENMRHRNYTWQMCVPNKLICCHVQADTKVLARSWSPNIILWWPSEDTDLLLILIRKCIRRKSMCLWLRIGKNKGGLSPLYQNFLTKKERIFWKFSKFNPKSVESFNYLELAGITVQIFPSWRICLSSFLTQ